MQPASIPRRFAASAVLAIAAVATVAGAPSAGPWRPAPAYVSLFAPPADRDSYDAYVTDRPVELVLRALQNDPALLRPPGAWEARSLLPLDVFGSSGPYDRSRLARLYGAQRVRAARGPRTLQGKVSETWLLVSPYPDPSLDRLQTGTLLLVLRVGDL